MYQSGLLRSFLWPVFGACTVGLFDYLSTLILICAQSGRVSGLVKETDPAAVQGATRGGSATTTNDCWVSLTSLVSLLVQKVR